MTDNERGQRDLNSLLAGESSDGIPPHVERRLRGRLEAFRDRVEGSASIRKPSSAASKYGKRRFLISIAGLVACGSIVVVISLNLMRTPTWANVVESVQRRPWIRCSSVRPDGGRMEFWFSSTKENRKLAARFGNVDFASYDDFERRERFSYRKRDGTILRRPLPNVAGPDLGIAGVFLGTFAPHDELLKQLNQDSRLVSQSRDEVTQDGQMWLQYRLVFEETHGKRERFIDTYLVDVENDLPRWWVRSSPDGTKSLRFRIEYPDSGPKNIYDLGVPNSTPVVDHVAGQRVAPEKGERGE